MKTPIPISATHAEARAQLEAEHAIDYRESILGVTVRAHCRCGWTSMPVNAGFIAQAAANRHHIAFVEHPLENRARYAIYREACDICNGRGYLTPEAWAATYEGPLSEGDIECPECWSGFAWTIKDRTDGSEKYAATPHEAFDMLEADIRFDQEATA